MCYDLSDACFSQQSFSSQWWVWVVVYSMMAWAEMWPLKGWVFAYCDPWVMLKMVNHVKFNSWAHINLCWYSWSYASGCGNVSWVSFLLFLSQFIDLREGEEIISLPIEIIFGITSLHAIILSQNCSCLLKFWPLEFFDKYV